MTETFPPSPITYTAEIAACSSYGLESSFGRSRNHVFRGTRLSTHQAIDPEAGTPEGGRMSDLVMLTNVDETLPEARARIRRELDETVKAWTERIRPARRRRLWARWSDQHPSLTGIDPTKMWDTTDRSQDQAMVDLIRLIPDRTRSIHRLDHEVSLSHQRPDPQDHPSRPSRAGGRSTRSEL